MNGRMNCKGTEIYPKIYDAGLALTDVYSLVADRL
jgi:hypothetical protein